MADAIPVNSDKPSKTKAASAPVPADVIADLTEQIRAQVKEEMGLQFAPVTAESPYMAPKGAKLDSHDAIRKDN